MSRLFDAMWVHGAVDADNTNAEESLQARQQVKIAMVIIVALVSIVALWLGFEFRQMRRWGDDYTPLPWQMVILVAGGAVLIGVAVLVVTIAVRGHQDTRRLVGAGLTFPGRYATTALVHWGRTGTRTDEVSQVGVTSSRTLVVGDGEVVILQGRGQIESRFGAEDIESTRRVSHHAVLGGISEWLEIGVAGTGVISVLLVAGFERARSPAELVDALNSLTRPEVQAD